ncbi:MAG: site-2 protease family protein [Deltaproteobacteria bacterium]|nr:site-2 protease family protein [Deltaproteobacteria bacterium]
MTERLPFLLLFYPVFLFSLSCHEAAHAWMANRFGDPTARLLGRITLNPIPHMDMIGTLFLPIFAILTGTPLIGWGKPVPVNSFHLRNPRKDELWVSALGPISNVVLALVFAALGRSEIFVINYFQLDQIDGMAMTVVSAIYTICHMGVRLNLALAVFNLIPIFPLDGGGVLRGLLPEKALHAYDNFARQSVILLLILFATGALKFVFIPVQVISNMLLPM